jgi:hypothetical protein
VTLEIIELKAEEYRVFSRVEREGFKEDSDDRSLDW